jgi:hypothetical protein
MYVDQSILSSQVPREIMLTFFTYLWYRKWLKNVNIVSDRVEWESTKHGPLVHGPLVWTRYTDP